MLKKLQIYIATRNRPEFIMGCVKSALNQNTLDNVEIIVSDNSTNDLTQKILKNAELDIKYIKRSDSLSAIDHLNKIINESDGTYLTIFHDDDILLPNYVSTVREILEADHNLAAAAPNALYLLDKQMSSEKLWKSNTDEVILNQNDLVYRYIKITSNNPPPFPGYMYRMSALGNIKLDGREAGKYSDFTFLLKIANTSKIRWIAEPLVAYRLHDNNDTKVEDIADRLKLLKFIYKYTNVKRKSSEDYEMRYLNWVRWSRRRSKSDGNKLQRDRTIRKFIIYYTIFRLPFKSLFWQRVVNKVLLGKDA